MNLKFSIQKIAEKQEYGEKNRCFLQVFAFNISNIDKPDFFRSVKETIKLLFGNMLFVHFLFQIKKITQKRLKARVNRKKL